MMKFTSRKVTAEESAASTSPAHRLLSLAAMYVSGVAPDGTPLTDEEREAAFEELKALTGEKKDES